METERLNKREWFIRDVPLSCAQDLIAKHHYMVGGSNTGIFVHGLFRKDSSRLWGVAWWLPPTRACAKASFDGDPDAVLALTRLVCIPEAPKNAASFLIGQSIRAIAADGRYECLLTYADTRMNHTGAIYRATNWEYIGLTKPTDCWLDANGRTVARKRGPRTLTESEMLSRGYRKTGSFAKHKFRKLLPVAKQSRQSALFEI